MPGTIYAHRRFEVLQTIHLAEAGIAQEQPAEANQKKTNRIDGAVQTTDGRTIAGVTLTLRSAEAREAQSLERQATGTQEGKFTFSDLPAGKYTLRAEAPGFQPVTKEVILSEGARIESVTRGEAGGCRLSSEP